MSAFAPYRVKKHFQIHLKKDVLDYETLLSLSQTA